MVTTTPRLGAVVLGAVALVVLVSGRFHHLLGIRHTGGHVLCVAAAAAVVGLVLWGALGVGRRV